MDYHIILKEWPICCDIYIEITLEELTLQFEEWSEKNILAEEAETHCFNQSYVFLPGQRVSVVHLPLRQSHGDLPC